LVIEIVILLYYLDMLHSPAICGREKKCYQVKVVQLNCFDTFYKKIKNKIKNDNVI